MKSLGQKEISVVIVERLREAGHTAYFAGGCVRDMILGVEPADYDVATDAKPEEVSALFARTVEVGARFGVVVVMAGAIPTEVATFRSDTGYSDGRHPDGVHFSSPEEDAARRDFTINGLFFDPLEDKVIDYVGGRRDIERGVIRAIGRARERFAEDQLRLLRAVRFSARLGFEIESDTRSAMIELAPKVLTVSPERICEEIARMLADGSRVRAIELLDETGLLAHILPEVEKMKGVEQPPEFHPEGDVFEHSKLCLSFLPEDASFTLALATLLHDVGKPAAFETRGDRMRYHRHEMLGAKTARSICRRLKMSRAEIEEVSWLVKKHMVFKDARKMRKSTLKRLLASEHFSALAQLCRADALASTGDTADYEYCLNRLQEFTEEQLMPAPLLTGRDLIEMGLTPGPIFSVILKKVYDEQLEGNISEKKEALELAARLASEEGRDEIS